MRPNRQRIPEITIEHWWTSSGCSWSEPRSSTLVGLRLGRSYTGGPELTADDVITEAASCACSELDVIGTAYYAVAPLAIAARVLAPEVEALSSDKELRSSRAENIHPYCAAVEHSRIDRLTWSLLRGFGEIERRLVTPEMLNAVEELNRISLRHICFTRFDSELTFEGLRVLLSPVSLWHDYAPESDERLACALAVEALDPQVSTSNRSKYETEIKLFVRADRVRGLIDRTERLWSSRVFQLY